MSRLPSWTLPAVLMIPAAVGCRRDTPEERIQKAFDACVKGVESKDPAVVIRHLGPRFVGPEGMDKDQARLALLGYLRHQKLGITLLENSIQVQGARAEQAVDIFLTIKGEGRVLPEDSTRRRFLLTWELLDDEWRLRELKEVQE